MGSAVARAITCTQMGSDRACVCVCVREACLLQHPPLRGVGKVNNCSSVFMNFSKQEVCFQKSCTLSESDEGGRRAGKRVAAAAKEQGRWLACASHHINLLIIFLICLCAQHLFIHRREWTVSRPGLRSEVPDGAAMSVGNGCPG